MRLVECVPNFSEGRRPEIIDAIRDAIAGVEGVAILDTSSDLSHNRTVITFVAPVEQAVEAAFAGIRQAQELIDLNHHTGEHPRMGAADVVPFIPLEGTTMDDCIVLARSLGERVGRELQIPVFLYERAATRPDRENLADVRRGEFEGLREQIGKDATRVPDFGPSRIHPTAGAVAIGARPFLVAYNVYLGPATNVQVAKDVAKALRHSTGGLRYVKALGLEVDGQAQVSMNLVDTEKTPLFRAFEMVRLEAAAQGVSATWSEIVGLVPERALLETAARHVQLRNFSTDMVLERRVRDGWHDPAMEIEIGRGKKGRQAYGFDDIAIVPSRRTRDPDDIDISWKLGPYQFELPMLDQQGAVAPKPARSRPCPPRTSCLTNRPTRRRAARTPSPRRSLARHKSRSKRHAPARAPPTSRSSSPRRGIPTPRPTPASPRCWPKPAARVPCSTSGSMSPHWTTKLSAPAC